MLGQISFDMLSAANHQLKDSGTQITEEQAKDLTEIAADIKLYARKNKFDKFTMVVDKEWISYEWLDGQTVTSFRVNHPK